MDAHVYTLTAELDGQRSVFDFDATSHMDATMSAIGEILNRAADDTHPQRDLWAKGRIELSYRGTVFHTMEAK